MSDPNEKSRVQVSVRVRPLLKTEESNCDPVVVSGQPDGRSVVVEEEGKRKRAFAYDHAFTGDQASLFETIGRPMLAEAFKGFNVCLFAYGQTGSGKTHSLLGDVENEQQQGVAPRFARSLFEEAQRMVEESDDLTIKISLSMIEVYMEKIRDLLVPRQRGVEPESLDIHEDAERRVYVKDVSVHHVMNFERMMDLLRKGNANRQTAETKMNETSSRSHAIMQITISQEFQSVEKRDLECMVSLVDLAGSERQAKTDTSGQRFEESKKINYSLMMLGRAMNSFSDRKNNEAFISLRESKLTRLLSESFGGNSKTWMLATVSPTAYNLGESISTLEYATNAMAITNKAIVNDVMKRIEVKEVKTAIASLEVRLRDLTLEKESQESKLAELQVERNALKASVTEPGNSAESDLDVSERLQKMLQYLRLSNIALKRRVEAASRQLIWSIDNNGSLGCYKGRCGVSLRSVLLGKRSSFVIQLATESGIASEARLKIQLFLVEALAAERTDVMQMVGRDLHFCLHVVGAEQLPEAYSAHSFCKFGMRYDNVEDRYFTTSTCEKTTNPTWGMAKQFKVLNLSEDAVRYLSEQSVFTFEVFGFAN